MTTSNAQKLLKFRNRLDNLDYGVTKYFQSKAADCTVYIDWNDGNNFNVDFSIRFSHGSDVTYGKSKEYIDKCKKFFPMIQEEVDKFYAIKTELESDVKEYAKENRISQKKAWQQVIDAK